MKELEDSPYFPSLLRNFQTEFIGFMVVKFDAYRAFIEYLNSVFIAQHQVTDLCSGSGEPAISIFRQTDCFNKLILTDKYPNPIAVTNDTISYRTESIDVLETKFQPDVCYTMFNSFHHFSKKEKLEIARRIKEAGARGFFVEILEPGLGCFLKILLITTLGTIVFTPFIRPFSWKRLLFTYIFPVNILTITYDGIISVSKSSTVAQYKKLFASYGDAVKVFRLKSKSSPLVIIQFQPE
ncbi:MAG: hypothetical protein M3R17_20545 [Bacteroidota bacterium]|nr:hypothetical protein [Bacteroidota bacterium]